MGSFLKFGAALLLLVLFNAAAARAAAEFCPAQASVPIPVGATFGAPATRYSYQLTAPTQRSVSATLIADTDRGWYTWNVGDVVLAATQRTFADRAFPPLPYTIAASPSLAVAFPVPVTIAHAWIVSARARSSLFLSWNGLGVWQCDVPAFDGPSDRKPADDAVATAPPAAQYPLAIAIATEPPFAIGTCAHEFALATVLKAEAPVYAPTQLDALSAASHFAAVQVAVDSDGQALDAWIWATSGNSAFNRASVVAALGSTYSGAISYCRPVKGTYLFRTTVMRD